MSGEPSIKESYDKRRRKRRARERRPNALPIDVQGAQVKWENECRQINVKGRDPFEFWYEWQHGKRDIFGATG